MIYCILKIVYGEEVLQFCGAISNCKTFPAYAIGIGYTRLTSIRKSFNFQQISLILHAAKVFPLTMYGIEVYLRKYVHYIWLKEYI